MNNRSIDVDGLVAAMQQFQEEFLNAAKDDVEEVCVDVANTITQELKAISPKKTGKYARSWKYTIEHGGSWTRAILHNGRYQIVHLLEYGHAKVNGGRVSPIVHVAPEQDKADREFISKLKRKIEAGK